MKAERILEKNGFSCYLASTGTKYYTGYVGDKVVKIRISDHAPNSEFIDSDGLVQYRDEPDYRIDPEQDDSEKIKAIFKKKYSMFFSYEEDGINGKVVRWIGKSEKPEAEVRKEYEEFKNIKSLSYKEYCAEKKKCINGKFYIKEA